MLDETISLHGPWKFEPVDGGPAGTINVPSQWTHGQSWGYPEEWRDVQQAWYSRDVAVPADWAGRDIRIHFGAVLLKAEVYAGDEYLGQHTGGFTPFEIDISRFAGRSFTLRVLVSSVVKVMPGERYVWQVSYPENAEEGPLARGIWQNVTLVARPPVHVALWKLVTRLGPKTIEIKAWVRNPGREAFAGTLGMALMKNRWTAADADFVRPVPVQVPAGGEVEVLLRRPLKDLPLWSHDHPVLLPAEFQLADAAGQEVHRLPARLGLREVAVGKELLLLNGRPVRLLGMSLVRTRVSPQLWRRDYLTTYFRLLKKIGFNALRVHGCIAPPMVYDVADEVGMLIEDQSALWSSAEANYHAGGAEFLSNVQQEFREWIPRDWNHPSVVMWDVENELVGINGRQIPNITALIDLIRSLDSSRMVVVSCTANVLDMVDLEHVHNQYRLDVFLDYWRRNPHRKPVIAGEWWPDSALRLGPCIQKTWTGDRSGFGTVTRLLQDFRRQSDIDDEIGRQYALTFVLHRTKGVAGSFTFSIEIFLFEQLFQACQKLRLKGTDAEPVGMEYAEAHFEAEMVNVRRPYVNPGWDPKLPVTRLTRQVAKPLRAALQPVIVALAEKATSFYEGRARRTLAMVNDSGAKINVQVTVRAGRTKLFSGRYSVADGAVVEKPISLQIPSRLTGKQVRLTADMVYGECHRAMDLGVFKVFPPPAKRLTLPLPVFVTGVPEAIAGHLTRRGVQWQELHRGVPAATSVWIVGAAHDVQREAVLDFVARGGRLIVLRQENMPEWIPALFGYRNSMQLHAPVQTGYGYSVVGREDKKILWAPVLAPDHPMLRGLPFGAMLGSWSAGDGGLADDLYAKDMLANIPFAGGVTPLVGANDTDTFSLAETAIGRGHVWVSQLYLAENLAANDAEVVALFDRLLAHAASVPSAGGALAAGGNALETDILHKFPHAQVTADAPPSLRLLDQPADIRAFLRKLQLHGAAADPVLARGGHVLCVVSAPSGRLGAWPVSPVGPTAKTVITTLPDRPPLLAGWTAADLDFWKSGACAKAFFPVEQGRSSWRDGVLAFAHDPVTARAGCKVDSLGSLLKWRRAGKGTVCVTTLDLTRWAEPAVRQRWESILANAGAALAPDKIDTFAEVHRIDVKRTPDLPLDGDYWKWACVSHDINMAPWSRATPQVLTVNSTSITATQPDLTRYGGIGYLLWNDRFFYSAAVAVAPEHSFGDSQFVFYSSDMELFIGPTQICVSKNTKGEPSYYLQGAPLVGAGLPAIRSHITVLDHVPSWPDIGLLPLKDKAGLKTCFFELAVPWEVLNLPKPTVGTELPVTLQIGFPDLATQKCLLQLVVPKTFRFEEVGTYAHGCLCG